MYVPFVCTFLRMIVPSLVCFLRVYPSVRMSPPGIGPLRVHGPPYVCPLGYVSDGIRMYVSHRIVDGVNRLM